MEEARAWLDEWLLIRYRSKRDISYDRSCDIHCATGNCGAYIVLSMPRLSYFDQNFKVLGGQGHFLLARNKVLRPNCCVFPPMEKDYILVSTYIHLYTYTYLYTYT